MRKASFWGSFPSVKIFLSVEFRGGKAFVSRYPLHRRGGGLKNLDAFKGSVIY
jgi:hypothetical protein